VVLLTAAARRATATPASEAGADEYLVKPFSPLQLIETIERLLAACS
jgi:two-component system phosphate regulon response regulator PhoB